MLFRKLSAATAVVMLLTFSLTGCAGTVCSNDVCSNGVCSNGVCDKGFVCEKDGFPDKFGIKLYNDGNFTYYEGMFSSFVGYGSWSLDGDTLILTENADLSENPRKFRFKVNGDTLSYIAEGSDNFTYVMVSDGEKFKAEDLTGFPF